MNTQRKQLAVIFIILFALWAGWVVLHAGDLATGQIFFQGPQVSWSNRDGYTDFELEFLNYTAHVLEVSMQAEVHSCELEGLNIRRGRLLGSKKIEVVMPAREELLVRDRISHAQEPAATEKTILNVEIKSINVSTRSRINRILGQLFFGGIVLVALLIGLRLLPVRPPAELAPAPEPPALSD